MPENQEGQGALPPEGQQSEGTQLPAPPPEPPKTPRPTLEDLNHGPDFLGDEGSPSGAENAGGAEQVPPSQPASQPAGASVEERQPQGGELPPSGGDQERHRRLMDLLEGEPDFPAGGQPDQGRAAEDQRGVDENLRPGEQRRRWQHEDIFRENQDPLGGLQPLDDEPGEPLRNNPPGAPPLFRNRPRQRRRTNWKGIAWITLFVVAAILVVALCVYGWNRLQVWKIQRRAVADKVVVAPIKKTVVSVPAPTPTPIADQGDSVDRLRNDLTALSGRINGIDTRVGGLDQKIKASDQERNQQFQQLMTAIAAKNSPEYGGKKDGGVLLPADNTPPPPNPIQTPPSDEATAIAKQALAKTNQLEKAVAKAQRNGDEMWKELLRRHIAEQHPDWTNDQVDKEVARAISDGDFKREIGALRNLATKKDVDDRIKWQIQHATSPEEALKQ